MPNRPTAALAHARAVVDVTARPAEAFSATAAAAQWQLLKQARGQDADLARLAPAHIIGQPAADVTLSTVAAIDAIRSRAAARARAYIDQLRNGPDLGGRRMIPDLSPDLTPALILRHSPVRRHGLCPGLAPPVDLRPPMDPHLPFPTPRSHAEEIANIEAWRNRRRAPDAAPDPVAAPPRDFDTAARVAPIRPETRPQRPAPDGQAAALAIAAILASGTLAALVALWVLA